MYIRQYFYRVMYAWLHNFSGEWEGWALVNWFNHTSWVTAVTPTDRPKSVRNSCVIKVFGGVFMLSRCFLDCSVGVWVFVTGLSQISSFFSYSQFYVSSVTVRYVHDVYRNQLFNMNIEHVLCVSIYVVVVLSYLLISIKSSLCIKITTLRIYFTRYAMQRTLTDGRKRHKSVSLSR